MKKKIHLIFSIILLIFLSSCAGYKPIFNSTNLQFNINDYLLEGNKQLANNFYSKLYNLSKTQKNNQSVKNLDFHISVLENKEATTKNTAGKILEYKITLNIEIKITDAVSDVEILNENFTSSTTYKTRDAHSETIIFENKSIDNLINTTYQKLLIKLSEIIVAK